MSTSLVITSETKALAITSMDKNKVALSFDTIFNKLPIVDNNTALVPLAECHAIVEMIEHCKEPAGETQTAADVITYMMGAFPQKDQGDTNMYLAHMVRVFAKYPSSLHKKVADEVVDTKSWRPAPADLVSIFDAHLTRWTYAKIIAGKHIKEHAKRLSAPGLNMTEDDKAATKVKFDKLIAKTFGPKDNSEGKE